MYIYAHMHIVEPVYNKDILCNQCIYSDIEKYVKELNAFTGSTT